jgi:hypothetical protein
VALIATAVAIGLLVLRNGFDQPDSGGAEVTVTTPSGDAAADGDAGEGDGDGATATTAPPVTRPASEISVLVANASGVQGAAGDLTDSIANGGYVTTEPANAPAEVPATQVFFAPGFDADAVALADQIGVPAAQVAPLADPPPLDVGTAQILILLGPDLASRG